MVYQPHSSAEFLVRHAFVILLLSPHAGYLVRLDEPEFPVGDVGPSDMGGVVGRVVQQVPYKLPKAAPSGHCGSETNTCHMVNFINTE